MRKRDVLKRKTNGKHTTYIDEAAPIIKAAGKMDEVRAIGLNTIVSIRSGKRHVRFVVLPAGLKIVVRGVNAIQDLFIYTTNADVVEQRLTALWSKEYG